MAERSVEKELSAEQEQIIRGWLLTLRGDIALFSGDIEQAVFLAQQALEVLPDVETLPRADALSTAILAYVVSGDVTPATEQEVTVAVAFVRTSNNLFATVGSMTLLARLHVLQGKLRQAAATYAQVEQVVPRSELLHTFLASLFYYFSLGDLLRERNQLEAAERHLVQAMALVKEKPTIEPFLVQLGYTTLARLQQARGNSGEALATLDALEQVAEQRKFPPHLRSQLDAERVQLELAQGNLAAAVRWAETCGLSVKDELSFPLEREHLALARVRIAQGHAQPSGPFLDEALALLARLLADAKAKARLHSALEMLVLTALALDARGDLHGSLDTLAEALSLAEPEGYVRLFLDEGAPLLALLSQVSKTHPHLHGYVQQLLAQSPVAPASPDQQPARKQPLVEPLSERELEVLHLMAAGASNEEIAEQLVIATGTVKRHVSNILAKLAVSNRTQAVARARQLDLL
jgi:LuxR family maltose regulon positive regulatory protein